jgi:dipeptidase E
MKNLIIASTSTLFGEAYLDYLLNDLEELFQNTNEILFIPFARPDGISHDQYTQNVAVAFAKINKKIVGLQTFEDKKEAIKNCKGIFVGGGNTFVLTHQLYQNDLWDVLKNSIINGVPYLGTSAGSNICGLSIQNTNDMPIVSVPSYTSLGVFPFNINPHYFDADPHFIHNGESRATRIKEYFCYNNVPVLGLKEGSFLRIIDQKIILKGNLTAKLFTKNKTEEIFPEIDLSFVN